MGRRVTQAGLCYHAINRGNERARVFHKPEDYEAFMKILHEAQGRSSVRLLGFCLMPNHWHLVVWPERDSELSMHMFWLTNAHAHRYRHHYDNWGVGHVYQGRYKSFPIQEDHHLLAVLRYVETNPVRAGLVTDAVDWPWSSYAYRHWPAGKHLLSRWPVDRPDNWTQLVHPELEQAKAEAIRLCIKRSRPYGSETWAQATAKQHGLHGSVKPLGRPRKVACT